MVDPNVATLSVKAKTGTTSRSLEEHLGGHVINVKSFGAKGDFIQDDTVPIQNALDAAFGTAGSPHGGADNVTTGRYLNRTVFFPPGHYKTTAPLTVRSMESAVITGAGKLVSAIQNVTSGSQCFRTNGCSRSSFEHLSFTSAAGGSSCAFWLGWDNTGSTALTGNIFNNVAFSADTGLLLGGDGNMGSENLITMCSFNQCATAGIISANYNMLDTSIIGCSLSENAKGVWVQVGQIENIQQCSFANNAIDIVAAAGVTNVMGCRSESPIFCSGSAVWNIESCNQSWSNGYFLYNCNDAVTLINCLSYAGRIGTTNDNGQITMIGCTFDRGQATVTGAANNGSGLIRLTVNRSDYWTTGDRVKVKGVGGVPNANGEWTITVIDGTHVDLQGSTFAGTYTSGGGMTSPNWLDQDLAVNYFRTTDAPAGLATFWRDRRMTKTAAYTIPRIISGAQFDNIGATGAIILTLPSLNNSGAYKKGTTFGFYVAAAQTLTIKAANSMTIRVAGTVSAANGTVSSNVVGNYIELTAIDGGVDYVTEAAVNATIWVAKSVVGTWTVT